MHYCGFQFIPRRSCEPLWSKGRTAANRLTRRSPPTDALHVLSHRLQAIRLINAVDVFKTP